MSERDTIIVKHENVIGVGGTTDNVKLLLFVGRQHDVGLALLNHCHTLECPGAACVIIRISHQIRAGGVQIERDIAHGHETKGIGIRVEPEFSGLRRLIGGLHGLSVRGLADIHAVLIAYSESRFV